MIISTVKQVMRVSVLFSCYALYGMVHKNDASAGALSAEPTIVLKTKFGAVNVLRDKVKESVVLSDLLDFCAEDEQSDIIIDIDENIKPHELKSNVLPALVTLWYSANTGSGLQEKIKSEASIKDKLKNLSPNIWVDVFFLVDFLQIKSLYAPVIETTLSYVTHNINDPDINEQFMSTAMINSGELKKYLDGQELQQPVYATAYMAHAAQPNPVVFNTYSDQQRIAIKILEGLCTYQEQANNAWLKEIFNTLSPDLQCRFQHCIDNSQQ